MHHPDSFSFKACRERSGLDQAELSHLLGLRHRKAISPFETGRRLPDARILIAYELAFGDSAAALLQSVTAEERTRMLHRALRLKRRFQHQSAPDVRDKVEFLRALIARLLRYRRP